MSTPDGRTHHEGVVLRRGVVIRGVIRGCFVALLLFGIPGHPWSARAAAALLFIWFVYEEASRAD